MHKNGNINPSQNIFWRTLVQVAAAGSVLFTLFFYQLLYTATQIMPGSVLSIIKPTCFSMTENACGKKRPCVSQRKKIYIYMYIMLWQNLYSIVIISLGETLEEKYVPFVAKMMAIIRNISVTKPLVVLWAMFFCNQCTTFESV